jgi:hypothetical protein
VNSGGRFTGDAVRHAAVLLGVQDDPRRQALAHILFDVAAAMFEIDSMDLDASDAHTDNRDVDRVLKQFLSPEAFEEIRKASDEYQSQGKDR